MLAVALAVKIDKARCARAMFLHTGQLSTPAAPACPVPVSCLALHPVPPRSALTSRHTLCPPTACTAARKPLPAQQHHPHPQHLLRVGAAARAAGLLGHLWLARGPVSCCCCFLLFLLGHEPGAARRTVEPASHLAPCSLTAPPRLLPHPALPCSSNQSGKRWSHRRRRVVMLAGTELTLQARQGAGAVLQHQHSGCCCWAVRRWRGS